VLFLIVMVLVSGGLWGRCNVISAFLVSVNVSPLRVAGIPRDHPESYHSFMWNHLFKYIDIDPKNAHILDGNAPDLQAECDRFETLISEAGGVELFIGGCSKSVYCYQWSCSAFDIIR